MNYPQFIDDKIKLFLIYSDYKNKLKFVILQYRKMIAETIYHGYH